MNQKVIFAKRSIELAKQGKSEALTYSQLSEAAYKSIQNITNTYNKNIANGKWDGIMSSHPRDLEVFKMPKIATKEMVDSNKNNLSNTITNIKPTTIILATDFRNKNNISGKDITIINGLGISGKGIAVLPFTALSSDTLHLEKTPYVDYEITLSKGTHSISIKALPTHSINQEYKVRYAISVNGDIPQIINLEAEASSKIWSKNVVNGFSFATTQHTILLDTISTIRLYILEPGVVINQLEIL